MRKVQNLGDHRNKGRCVHCGAAQETVDHNPSRVFLDTPLPPDIPASPACTSCNNGFSADEAYTACLIECAATVSCEPDGVERPKIAALLRRDPALRALMSAARRDGPEGPLWQFDQERISRIIVKLARGHAAFEMNEPQTQEPARVTFVPLVSLTEEQLASFEDDLPEMGFYPEIASRAFNRIGVADGKIVFPGWLTVQEGRYRYAVRQAPGMWVRMVIREYLACEVIWG
ncbi:hypothetical protein [Paracraurococcus lichenis]|uniref:HNH endonuclease n=1 Tax=Paracraurococcus lichenis TaxID=3064888 RepID=A0ABT9E6P5_9PROT|nr:hypothetical protein [Paracraurococcus sp. LOR1-02]MDO9711862.1 hypothetical protein [Paracraurococcus sp. LOR1-02]